MSLNSDYISLEQRRKSVNVLCTLFLSHGSAVKFIRFSSSIVLLWGVPRYALAFVIGALSALAMPPFGAFPVLALTFPVLVWLMDGTGAAGGRLAALRAAAMLGWWFGFGYFLGGLWWIGAAFLVDADNFGWMMPFAVIALPAGLALFHAFGLMVARILWSERTLRIFALAFGLGAAEWLRGHVLTGFPWNSFGYALADTSIFGQWAAFIGMEGLTPAVIALFALPATLTDFVDRLRWRPLAAGIGVFIIMGTVGALRLAGGETAFTNVAVRIMQPNVPQDEKFRPENKAEIMSHYLSLSDEATSPERQGLSDVDLLIWPESAFPFFLSRTPDALAAIGAALPDRTVLLTGAARVESAATESHPARYTNAMQMINSDGVILGSYDKVRLVPFGEFLPFQALLEKWGINQLTNLPGGFSAGDRPRTLTLPNGLIVAPLICYEAIFPERIIDNQEKPHVLINITNDAWFGRTPGPYQHLAQARVRAIELGIPLVRAANTGVSAVLDSYGRKVSQLDLGAMAVLDAWIPQAIPETLYARYQVLIIAIIYFLMIIFACLGFRRV
jgi:apolipoprotein N-acyltransferase